MARVPQVEIERLKEQCRWSRWLRRTASSCARPTPTWSGGCPFDGDKTPSLVVTPAKNLWHCLGACQTGGGVVDWVMRAYGVVLARGGAAARRHADRPGVEPVAVEYVGSDGGAEAVDGAPAPAPGWSEATNCLVGYRSGLVTRAATFK